MIPSWHPHIEVWFLFGGIYIAYLLAWRTREQQIPAAEDPGRTRKKVWFSIGIALMIVGADWPVHELAERSLYSVHMLQHMMFSLIAPAFLLLGTPDWMARRLLAPRPIAAVWRVVSRPFAAFVIFNVVLLASHWPEWVNATVGNEPLHLGAHTILVLASILMWWPVLSPLPEYPRLSRPGQMMYLFLLSLAPTVPASFLTFGESPLYTAYENFARPWGMSALEDMRIAGLLMKLGGGFILWGVIAAIFFRWYAEDQRGEGWGELTVTDADIRALTSEEQP